MTEPKKHHNLRQAPDNIDLARTLEVAAVRYFPSVLLLVEMVFSLLIIQRIAYTEIDWIAYMQEVKGFLEGERNYMNLKGDTGPLVYPAGFVYVFSGLYWITNEGADIRAGILIGASSDPSY
jgi:alpha-1,3-mannosyltransferase